MAVAAERFERLARGTALLDPPDGGVLARACAELDRSLRRYLTRKLRSVDDAADMAQEVFLRIAGLRDPQAVRCLHAFAFKTAENLLRDRARRVHTRVSRDAVDPEQCMLADPATEPARQVESRESLAVVTRALVALKPATRDAFLWHRLEGRPHAEIAAALGISVSMVEKHVSAASAAIACARQAEWPPNQP
jgi:RNA polymerase sigma-70 factor (ECF subfamily)